MGEKRHFRVIQDGKEYGLYKGSTPISAAKKVISKLSDGQKMEFYLRETTKGSEKKIYGMYGGMKRKLEKARKIGNRIYEYESEVKKIGGGFFGRNESKIIKLNAMKDGKQYEIQLEKHRKDI